MIEYHLKQYFPPIFESKAEKVEAFVSDNYVKTRLRYSNLLQDVQ